jgi:hypothetical protein
MVFIELEELEEEPFSPSGSASVVDLMELEELSDERCSCTGGGASTVELEELSEERFSCVVCAIRRGDSD